MNENLVRDSSIASKSFPRPARIALLLVCGPLGAWAQTPAADGPAPTVGTLREVTVTTPATCVEDSAEQDDSPAVAVLIGFGSEQQRNICGSGDTDWFKFSSGNQDRYYLIARTIGGGAAVRLSVYASDGTTLLGSATAPAVNTSTSLGVLVPKNQTVYIKAEPAFANLTGTAVLFGMKVVPGYGMLLPIILK